MLVKKYEAKDMQQAMDDIVKELGSEAVILNSRKIRKKGLTNFFQKPIVEVMVAYEPKKPQNARKPNPATQHSAREAYSPFIIGGNNNANAAQQTAANGAVPLPSNTAPISSAPSFNTAINNAALNAPSTIAAEAYIPASQQSNLQPFTPRNISSLQPEKPVHSQQPANQLSASQIPSNQLSAGQSAAGQLPPGPYSDIDSRISNLDSVLNEFMNKFSHIKRDVTYNFSPEVEELLLTMKGNEVREELALSLAKETEEILKSRPDARPREVVQHLICERISATAPISLKKYKQKIILMLGSTGVGKTTSLVKLASHFTINQKKKVGIINTDTYRIAAHEQLRIYADILDIPLGIAYRMEDLTEALAGMNTCDVIFIDTAGKRPGDPQHREDIIKLIEYAAPEDILLCVAAPTSFSSIAEIIDAHSFIEDYKLLITKMDETKYRGMVLNIANYAKRPLSYIATGQNVPDDLEAADTDSLARQILER